MVYRNRYQQNKILFFTVLLGLAALSVPGCREKRSDLTGFSFAFITDTHIKPDSMVVNAFNKAIDSINSAGVDFVISGGDQVFDVNGEDFDWRYVAYE